MKWFNKWFRNKCRQAWESPEDEDVIISNTPVRRPPAMRHSLSNSNDIRTPGTHGINFILYPAAGGNILEIRMYDEKSGDNHASLHIIPIDQDLGESIGKIITIEALKR